MTKKYFITATGTDIGKTAITAALAREILKSGNDVLPLKPVISGWDGSANCDTAKLLEAAGLDFSQKNIDKISPWRFKAPLSPDMAAAKEGKEIDFKQLINFCIESLNASSDYIFIEGVGGVMVPLNKNKTVLDWIEELSLPVILITGSYLGTISHTLTAIEALASRKIKPQMVIINESQGGVDLSDTKGTIRNFSCDIEICEVTYQPNGIIRIPEEILKKM